MESRVPEEIRLRAISHITQRRRQLLVHSYIYYELNDNVISDEKWNQWAEELVFLQNHYPELARRADFAEYFLSFTGSTGFDLPFLLAEIVETAQKVYTYYKKLETK